jgi:dihydroxyacetone kinase
MTRDKIQQLAKEAGMNVSMWNYGAGSMAFTMGIEGVARGAMERFANLVAAEVMEEDAKVCEKQDGCHDHIYAAAIRARKPA